MPVSVADELAYVQSATLRRLREDKGITLRQAAKEAYIALSFLSEIELGRKNPSPQTIGTLLHYYGLTADDWYKEQHFTLIGKGRKTNE